MFANIPKHIISAVGPAYLTRPAVTIASLFGTTPCTLNAKLNHVPKSFNDPVCKNDEPADNTKNPTIVLIVPFTTSSTGFFCKHKPINAIKPTKIDGVDNNS